MQIITGISWVVVNFTTLLYCCHLTELVTIAKYSVSYRYYFWLTGLSCVVVGWNVSSFLWEIMHKSEQSKSTVPWPARLVPHTICTLCYQWKIKNCISAFTLTYRYFFKACIYTPVQSDSNWDHWSSYQNQIGVQ